MCVDLGVGQRCSEQGGVGTDPFAVAPVPASETLMTPIGPATRLVLDRLALHPRSVEVVEIAIGSRAPAVRNVCRRSTSTTAGQRRPQRTTVDQIVLVRQPRRPPTFVEFGEDRGESIGWLVA